MVVANISPQRCHSWEADTKSCKLYCLCVGIRILFLPPQTFRNSNMAVVWSYYIWHSSMDWKQTFKMLRMLVYSSKKNSKMLRTDCFIFETAMLHSEQDILWNFIHESFKYKIFCTPLKYNAKTYKRRSHFLEEPLTDLIYWSVMIPAKLYPS